jgi:hypothetical protein
VTRSWSGLCPCGDATGRRRDAPTVCSHRGGTHRRMVVSGQGDLVSLLDDTGTSSEERVVQRVRDGDAAAFGLLYERHLGAARRLARSLLADPSDADDDVAEVFSATLAAIRKGRGPADDVRPYVLTAVRRECQRSWRRSWPTSLRR